MADDPTQGNAPAATPVTPTAPAATTPPASTPQAGTPAAGDPSEPMTLEEARKLRRELNSKTAKLKEYEDAQAAAELAKLGEAERQAKLAEQAIAKVTAQAEAFKQRIAIMAVQLAATKMGIIDPEVAATLIAGNLKLSADGTPENADELLTDLLKVKPYLKAALAAQEPAPQAPRPTTVPTNPARGATAGATPFDWKTAPKLSDPSIWKK